jgi:hypothetical protein
MTPSHPAAGASAIRRPYLAAALLIAALALLAGPVASRAAAALTVTPTPRGLRAVLGGKPASETYTLTNDGPLTGALTLRDPVPDPFGFDTREWVGTYQPHCPEALGPGASCTVTMGFDPPVLGTSQATWQVILGGELQEFNLYDNASPPHLRWQPHQGAFGTVSAADPQVRTITLESRTSAEVKIDRLHLEGDESYALLGDDCAGRWLPGLKTCSARVRFRPRGTGAFHATLVAVAPAGRDPVFQFREPLSGSGPHAG